MIRLASGPADAGEIVISFPEHAETIDGQRCIPTITLDRPTTPSRKAAELAAWRAVPVPDQDESDEDFALRAAPMMEALGFTDVIKRAGLSDGIQAAVQALDLVKMVQMHIRSWEHFGDQETGQPIEPTPQAVQALILGHPVIARRIEREINAALGRVVREGNA